MHALLGCLLLAAVLHVPAMACDPAPTRVTGAYRGAADPGWRPRLAGPPAEVGLGDTVTVVATDLPKLFEEAACRGGSQVVLFLDRRPIPDVVASPPSDPAGAVVSFPLRRTDVARAFWVGVLGAPTEPHRTVEVSVGLSNGFAVPSSAKLSFVVVPVRAFLFWCAMLVGAILLFWLLAVRSDMLRDPAAQPPAGTRRAYSMARVQAAWWFFVVLGCYLFVGVVTGDFFDSIGGGALALLGLSAGTAAGSAAIDSSKDTPAVRADTAALVDRTSRDIGALQPGEPADDQRAAALRETTQRALGQSLGFLGDILSDANGVTFHRFQLLVWSVVLAVLFAVSTWRDLAMPPFDTGMLGAYAVSAATFLGLKLPEPSVPTPPT